MKAVILFGHGSRDPLWKQPMEAVAARVGARCAVRCAYLELDAPDLSSAASELVEAGATEITVLPLFLGVGRHAREDLPGLMHAAASAHPAVRFRLRPAVGEDPRVLDLLAVLALE